MQTARPPRRWRAGVKAALYLIAFGIMAGGALIAIGVLFFLFAGVLLGGGILAALIGLGLISYWRTAERRPNTPR